MNLVDLLSVIGDWLGIRLFEVGGTIVTGASVITFLVVLLVSLWVSRFLQRVVQRLLVRSGLAREDGAATTKRLLHYTVMVVGLGVALQAIGISLASVFAAGAVAAVAIGFALQNILQNFVSGVILLGERSIKETDILEVEGVVVRVNRMGARATVARTRDEEDLIIPNSTLVQSTVKNLTLTDRVHRIRAQVGVSYRSDMSEVEKALLAAATSIENRATAIEPVALLIDFGDSSVVWEVSIWVADPWTEQSKRSDLHKAIWWGLASAGITIAYPQLDVHFDAVPDSIGAGPGRAQPE
jgi:small-conductance mechanosensitive channel